MSATEYLIKLKPITSFFFGGENTFGEEEVNYSVRSNYLPQQTSILGMLRYELLAQNGLLTSDPNNSGDPWKTLIGSDSFKESANEPLDFGAIKKMSPVFLSDGTGHFIPGSLDWSMGENNGKESIAPVLVSFVNDACSDTGISRPMAPELTVMGKPYDPKRGIRSFWINANGKVKRQWQYEEVFDSTRGFENGFFIEQNQIGIHRKKSKKAEDKDEGDFYKRTSFNLADNFYFALFVTLDLPAGKKLNPGIVTLGGERSAFEMSIEATSIRFETLFTGETFSHIKQQAIILSSDAFAEKNILDHCNYSITETVPFRNIRTKQTSNGDYSRINGGALEKSGALIYLLKRGSVLFGENTEVVKNALQNESFMKIGYNHYIEVKK